MRSSHRELEKKMQKSPDWVDLWENGRPSGTYKMRVRDSFDVRTMSVELSDSLSLLELNEYAEDLFKTGRWGDLIWLNRFSIISEQLLCTGLSVPLPYFPSVCLCPCLSISMYISLSLSFSLSLSSSLFPSLSLFLSLSLSLSLSYCLFSEDCTPPFLTHTLPTFLLFFDLISRNFLFFFSLNTIKFFFTGTPAFSPIPSPINSALSSPRESGGSGYLYPETFPCGKCHIRKYF